MAKKTIAIELDVDSKSLGQLEQQLEEVNQELKSVDRNSDSFKELTAKSQILNSEIQKINNTIEGFTLEDKLMAADGAAKVFGGSLSAAVGTLGALGIESEAFGEFEQKAASAIAVGLGIKDVSEGFSQVALAAKKSGIAAKLFGTTTRKALVATGIGAFVVALGTVVTFWDDITKGVKRFASNVPFVGKAIEVVKDTFDSLLNSVKPVLKFLGIMPSDAEIAAEKTKEAVKGAVQEIEREIALAQARGDSERILFKLKRSLLEEEIRLLKLNGDEKETIFAKETAKLALELGEQKRLREEAESQQQNESVNTVNRIKAKGLAELETNIEVDASMQELADREKIRQKGQGDIEKLSQQQKLGLAKQTLGQMTALFGEGSKVGKAAAIAQAGISGAEATINAFKTASNNPITTLFPPYPFIQAGIAAAFAAKNIAAIKSAPTMGGSGGGGATPSAPPRPAPPSFNIVGAAPESQLAQTIGEKEDKPVKAFVVSNDVTTAQSLDRNIIESASI